MPDPMRENEMLNKMFGGRPTTLDLRAFIQPFDRGGVVLASVLAGGTGRLSSTSARAPNSLAVRVLLPPGAWG